MAVDVVLILLLFLSAVYTRGDNFHLAQQQQKVQEGPSRHLEDSKLRNEDDIVFLEAIGLHTRYKPPIIEAQLPITRCAPSYSLISGFTLTIRLIPVNTPRNGSPYSLAFGIRSCSIISTPFILSRNEIRRATYLAKTHNIRHS